MTDDWPVVISRREYHPIPEAGVDQGRDARDGADRLFAVSVAPKPLKRLFVLASRTKLPTAPDPTHSDDPGDDLGDWVPASEILDLSNHGESMFTRSRPLSSTPNLRIARGLRDYCDDRLEPYAAVIETLDEDDIHALQDDVVAVEDLSTMSRLGGYAAEARRFAEWSYGRLRDAIEQKVAPYNTPVVGVEPRSTSQWCSRCGRSITVRRLLRVS